MLEVDVGEEIAGRSGEALVECVFLGTGVHANHYEWGQRRTGVRQFKEACRNPGVLGRLMQWTSATVWLWFEFR